jgi:hypothetical protein
LGVRRLALGTFVGGWDPSICFYANQHAMVGEWLHGLRQMFVPINASVLGPTNPLTIAWYAFLALAAALSVKTIWRDADRGVFLFLVAWWLLSMVPLYRFFMIDPNLLNARLAYLATVPLCMFLTYGLGKLSLEAKYSRPLQVAGCLYILLSAVVLFANNTGFARGAKACNRIVSEIGRCYAGIAGDPPVKILGLPLALDGAYVATNAIDGMTKAPVQKRDIFNCRLLEDGEQSFPLGFLAQSIAAKKSDVRFFFWDPKGEALRPAYINSQSGTLSKSFQGGKLFSMFRKDSDSTGRLDLQPHGSVHVRVDKPAALDLDMPRLPCDSADFLAIDGSIKSAHTPSQIDLGYLNDVVQEYSPQRRCRGVFSDSGPIRWLFSLRALPSWMTGGTCAKMRLYLPRGFDGTIEKISILDSQTIMPKIAVLGCDRNSGVVHLDGNRGVGISYDCKGISGCQAAMLEVLPAGASYGSLNTEFTERAPLFGKICEGAFGSIIVTRQDFPSAGLYKARIRAMDSKRRAIGVASDHFLIWIDS